MIPRVLIAALAVIASPGFAQTLPKPDMVVAADGSGDFKTVQAAGIARRCGWMRRS
jgi:hypothetical protein